MSCSIEINWKSISALGLVTVGIIFALRMNPNDVKEAFGKFADVCAGAIAAARS